MDIMELLIIASICPLSLFAGGIGLFIALRSAKMIVFPWERAAPVPSQSPRAEWQQPVEFYRPEPFHKVLKCEAKNIGMVVQREERSGWTYSHCSDGAGVWWVHFLKERSWRSGHRCNYYPNNN